MKVIRGRVIAMWEVRSRDEGLEGAYRTKEAAERYVRELRQIGVTAWVVEVPDA